MATGMDYSLVQRIIDGLGKILDTKPGSPDEGTYVTEQQLADWIKGQTVVSAYYYNGVMYSDALHTTPITGQAGALYIDQDNNVLYRWDGAAWDAMSDNQLRQDILDGTVVAKKAECDQNGNTIDSTYATKTEMQTADANLNNAINQLDHRLENIEQSKGDYIVSAYKDGSITPSGKGNWAVVEGLRGVSRVENNQLPSISTFNTYQVTKGTTVDNVLTVSNFTGLNAQVYCNCPISLGRTVLAGVYLKPSVQTTAMLVIGSQKFVENVVCPANTWTFLGNVITISGTADVFSIYPNRGNEMGSADSAQIKLVGLTDLSVYFAGDPSVNVSSLTIAEIQTNYPHLLLPSDYGTRIVDWTGNGVRAWARNLWDEVWEAGGFWSTGQNNDSYNGIRAKNYIDVTPNTLCYITYQPQYVFFYDGDNNIIGYATTQQFTTPPNCIKVRFSTSNAYGQTYHNNICLNVSDANDGTYTPYHAPTTLSFPSTSLKSAGSVAEMYYPESGEQTHPLRRMTFDDDTYWQRSNDGVYFTDSVSGLYDENNLPLCPPYVAVSKASGNSDAYSKGDMTCCFRGTVPDRLYIRDDYAFVTMNYTAAQFKEYIKGKTLTFALATPDPSTFVTPILDNTLLTEAGGRMATVQTGTVVDGSFDMGFITL